MACELTLTGNLVVGGDCGCGGSGSSSSGGQKIQPMSLGCAGQTYNNIQSSDCATRISSTTWVPLPIGPIDPVSFLFVKTGAPLQMRWGGAAPVLTGSALSGAPIVFAGGEAFTFKGQTAAGTTYTAAFVATAGTFTLQQVADRINAAALTAGSGYMPVTVVGGTQFVITGGARAAAQTLQITVALAAIGFPATTTVTGTDPTLVSINGMFLSQFSPAVTGGFQVMGVADVVVMAAG